jgi:uncharacterized coiled-coil DUF342 family protein
MQLRLQVGGGVSEHFADITSIDTRRPHPVEHFEPAAAYSDADVDTLFSQRDEAIAESLILRRRMQQLTAERDALARRVAELGLENGRLRSRLAEAGLT